MHAPLLPRVCLWLQASDSPFGADAVQDNGSSAGGGGGGGERHSTIHEAAEDIADAWGKAPQPRRDAHRQKQAQAHQGVVYNTSAELHIHSAVLYPALADTSKQQLTAREAL